MIHSSEPQYTNILHDTALNDAAAACKTHGTVCPSIRPSHFDDYLSTQEPLSRIPATQPPQLLASLQKFSAWLSGLEVVQSPRLAHLTHQRLHSQIHHAALARLARTYGRLCDEVRKPENKYEAASTLLGTERPFGQVHLLWQIFGLEEDEMG